MKKLLEIILLSRISPRKIYKRNQSTTDHFTVICSVTWPLNGSEAR